MAMHIPNKRLEESQARSAAQVLLLDAGIILGQPRLRATRTKHIRSAVDLTVTEHDRSPNVTKCCLRAFDL